jgi:N-acetyl-gamma-glutamyl-phosphate reductase
MTDLTRIAVLGASGYTGADLVRLALGHPKLTISALTADRKAGQPLARTFPHLAPYPLPDMASIDAVDWSGVDVVFACLPHAATAATVKELAAQEGLDRLRIIDLSADFRLRDASTYAQWYGGEHPAPDLLPSAVYGLTEYARASLSAARLVACPGCYPTAALLALLPLVEQRLIKPQPISIMALSGVSGAGRSLKEQNLFCEVAEAMHPYGIGSHRHMPEIEQELSAAANQPLTISFTPHLIPINRGELETITVDLSPGKSVADLKAALDLRYADEPFVHVLEDGVAPATRHVRGSNHCVINVFADRIPGRALVIVAIDNLVKGSSGQAIQNLNAMMGWPETLGLQQPALFP